MKAKLLNIDLSKLSKKSKTEISNALKSAYDKVLSKYAKYVYKVLDPENDVEALEGLYNKYKRVINEYFELGQALRTFGIVVDF